MTLLLCCQYLCCPSFLVKVSCHFVYIVIWEKISNYQEEDPINGSNHATCLCRSQAGAVFPGYMLLSFSIKWFEVSSSCWYWYFLFTYSGFDSGYFFSALSKSFFFTVGKFVDYFSSFHIGNILFFIGSLYFIDRKICNDFGDSIKC